MDMIHLTSKRKMRRGGCTLRKDKHTRVLLKESVKLYAAKEI